MKIKKATKKDIKEIAKIYQEAFTEEPFNEKWNLKEAINKIRIFSKYCDIWIALEKKKTIGFFIINPHWWKLGEIIFGEDLVIKKEFREKGIATKLFQYVFDYYKKRGYKKFMGIINKDAKSFGFIKKLNLKIQKHDILIERKLK